MFKITKNTCNLLWCMMLMHFCQNAISIVGGDDVGIEEPVKELCPCLPREVCPHNHALSSSDAIYLGTILKCDRPNEARCCSISFDSSESSVTLKGDAIASDASVSMQRSSSVDIELTTISNEIDSNTDANTNELIESTDASNNDYDTTTSLNDEEQPLPTTTFAPQKEDDDDGEQQRREEIQKIYASKDFNGTNPSYLQIINNSPTLLVYATSSMDWNATYGDNFESNSIGTTTEQPATTEVPTESAEFEIPTTEIPSFETNNLLNANEFVSTMEHDNLTDVHHGIKRQSIYPEYYENEYEELDDGNDFEEQQQPDEFDDEDEDDGSDDGGDDDGDTEYNAEIDYDAEHKTQITAVQSLLSTMQKQLSGGVQKPVNNRFSTIEQMVENSKQQFALALGQADANNNYKIKPQTTTTTPTTTTTTTTTQKPRKYLHRHLPAAVERPKITATHRTTKPTSEMVEHDSSSLPKSEFHDNSAKLHTVLERRNQLFNSKRRNILAERHHEMTSPSSASEMTTAAPTTTTTTTTTTAHPKSIVERISSTRQPNRNHASQHRFRFRQHHK